MAAFSATRPDLYLTFNLYFLNLSIPTAGPAVYNMAPRKEKTEKASADQGNLLRDSPGEITATDLLS
jgi:hypothetical protein